MKGLRDRRRGGEAGFSLIEVAISSLVLVVSLSGLVVTNIYSRNLSESSKHLWHATNAASATLEEIRHQSTSKWSDVTNWNGMHCDYGIGDPIDPYAMKLAAEVTDDASVLDRSTGMWTTGVAAPNFYFVEIHTVSSADEFASALDFQTYVADRQGLKDLSSDNAVPVSGGAGGAPADAATSALNITTTPTNVLTADAKNDYKLAFSLANGGASNQTLTGVTVTATKNTAIGAFRLNGVALYDNMAKSSNVLTVTGVDTLMPAGVAPGEVTMNFESPKGSFAGVPLTVALTFADGSVATITVTP
jgi:Tfp pilus assembly protein PilV